MIPGTPLVSIVTPTLNAGRYLQESIESVLGQDYPNIEYLAVDSHSTDGTLDILQRYAGRLRTIAAPRQGPAAAIHAGFLESHGSILAWLNADDVYEPSAVRLAVEAFLARPEAGVIYGDASWIDGSGAVIRPYPTGAFDPATLNRDCFICQPASFFRAAAYQECALDPSLPVSFDYDLWIRMAAQRRRFEYVPHRLANSRMHAACLTLSCRKQVFEVTMALLKKHYGYIPLSWVFGYLSFQRDGRDQFFEPLRCSGLTYAASLPAGLSLNRAHSLRYLEDWVSTALRGLRGRRPEIPTTMGGPGGRPAAAR
jgi:glycosyltransferase involved in cell wall biosynthesis